MTYFQNYCEMLKAKTQIICNSTGKAQYQSIIMKEDDGFDSFSGFFVHSPRWIMVVDLPCNTLLHFLSYSAPSLGHQ